MISLRMRVVEAVADVFRDAGHKEPFASSYAGFAVDKALDCLTENAFDDQAFSDEALEGVCLADFVALTGLSGLIAILRGDR